MPVSELMDFTGGVATAVAPHLLPTNEALLAINTDLRSGVLMSLPEAYPLQVLDGRYFYLFNGKVYSYNNLRSNVLWDGKWYWADGTDSKKVMSDGTVKDLGLAAPTARPTISAGAGTLPHTGTFNYTYTYYDSITGTESAPVELSNSLTVTNKDIVVTGFQVVPPLGATNIRLYRVGGYLSKFTLVDTLAVNTTTYTDTLDVSKIDGRLLQTLRTSVPPTDVNYIVEFNGRIYGASGNKVYFSALGNPDAWYVDDYYLVNSTITGLGTTGAGLVVFTAYTTNVLRGSGPENFFMKEISASVGCVGHHSIAQYQDSIMWLSADAFVMTDGFVLNDLTSNKIKNISGMYPRGTIVKNLTYLMAFGPILTPSISLLPAKTLFPNRVIGGTAISEGIIGINFTLGRMYSYSVIESKGIGNLGNVSAKLLQGSKVSTIAFPVCSTRLTEDYFLPLEFYLSDLGSVVSNPRIFRYTSPMLIDTTYSTLKEYEKVRIVFSGSFTVVITLDGSGIVTSRTFSDSDSTDGFIILGIPNASNKGYGIQFDITGAGSIKSIQYTWKPREIQ